MDASVESGAGIVAIELPYETTRPVVGVGGELKNALCTVSGRTAEVGTAIGDLADADNYRVFVSRLESAVTAVTAVSGTPCVLAHDLHPSYMSTTATLRLADRLEGVTCEAVQHHHAHVAACMAERGIDRPVIGVACDGTGYGSDGAIWGGEVLYVTPDRFARCGHLAYFPLPGGDAAATQTWRPALSLVGAETDEALPSAFDRVPAHDLKAVRSMLRRGFNCPLTSSLGRLFDAVAFLAGVCDRNEFEGQAAIQLQQAAEGVREEPYPFHLADGPQGQAIVTSAMIASICEDVRNGLPTRIIAARFHATVAEMFVQVALAAARAHQVDTVVLTGGCFLNTILSDRVEALLTRRGIRRVMKHQRLSPGDASLSLGQAYATAARLRRNA